MKNDSLNVMQTAGRVDRTSSSISRALPLAILVCSFALLSGMGGCSQQVQSDGSAADSNPTDSAATADAPGSDSAVADTKEAEPAATGELVAYRDLAYAPPPGVESELATLDVFRVDDGQERPLVLLVHGGSWASGDKAGFEENIVPWWLEQGYVAAPVNFRLASKFNQAPVVKPADQVRDIAAALAWLMTQAETYKIATQDVVLLGYSSGAHLVALLASDETYLQQAGLSETQVSASISLDVHAYDVPYALTLMVGSVVESNIPVIKHLFGSTETEQLQSSPIAFVDGWAARTLLISVDEDVNDETTHGYIVSKAAQRYVTALTEAGHQAETFHDSTENHASLVGGFGAPGDAVTEVVKTFIGSLGAPSQTERSPEP